MWLFLSLAVESQSTFHHLVIEVFANNKYVHLDAFYQQSFHNLFVFLNALLYVETTVSFSSF